MTGNSSSSLEQEQWPDTVITTDNTLEHDRMDQAPPSPSTPPPTRSTASAASKKTPADLWLQRNSTALLEACCNHDSAKARRILEQSTPPSLLGETKADAEIRMKRLVLARDDFRDSALHLASGKGEVDIVRLLLARGADVTAENNLGSTPLNRAAVAGRIEVSLLDRTSTNVSFRLAAAAPFC